MRLHNAIAATALIACSVLAYGCSATVTTTPSDTTTLSPPANCSADSSLNCTIGDGWSCVAGTNPESDGDAVNLSCSVPQADPTIANQDDFCCIQWTSTSTTCTPDDQLTSACQYPALGYTCATGDDPTSLDSSLTCSTPVADPNVSGQDDFCCQ